MILRRGHGNRAGYTLMICIAFLYVSVWMLGGLLNRVEVETLTARHAVYALRAELLAQNAFDVAITRVSGGVLDDEVVIERGDRIGRVSIIATEDDAREIIAVGEVSMQGDRITRHVRARIEMNTDGAPRVMSYTMGSGAKP